MFYRIAANFVMILHILFILFVLFGSLLILWRSWIIWLHMPVAVWGIAIEVVGLICPLTPLENWFRRAAEGGKGYSGGFVEHYLLSIIYPDALTRKGQLVLGGIILMLNACLYMVVLKQRWKKT